MTEKEKLQNQLKTTLIELEIMMRALQKQLPDLDPGKVDDARMKAGLARWLLREIKKIENA